MDKITAKIFIDGGEPTETKEAKKLLGHLEGQTTNPTLIAKNLKEQRTKNKEQRKLTQNDALDEYKRIVVEMNKIIPDGSISIQVFADMSTKAEEMLEQARLRHNWVSNSSIKFPCTTEGLKAASVACHEMPINITLVFSQSQAAAVYLATIGTKFPVFISPFVGRLDDRGENGMDVVSSIIKMYQSSDHHVEVLTASTRNLDHVLYALQLKSDIITIPFKVFRIWADSGFQLPGDNYIYNPGNLGPIPYQTLDLSADWTTFDLRHDLTDKGVAAFFSDWNSLFQ